MKRLIDGVEYDLDERAALLWRIPSGGLLTLEPRTKHRVCLAATGGELPDEVMAALVQCLNRYHRQEAEPLLPPPELLNTRVPQPGRYADYGVPVHIALAADMLLQRRNRCSDAEVPVIDAAVLRLLAPWIRRSHV